MATDRGAVLTIRAAANRVIDFRRCRLRDVKWWRRTNVLLEAMARDDDELLLDAAYRYHLALVGNPGLSDESWARAKKDGLDIFNDMIGLIHPWGAKTAEQRHNEQMAEDRELYKKIIGDPDDPEFKAVLDAEVRRLMNPGIDEVEDELARIDRLYRDRVVGR